MPGSMRRRICVASTTEFFEWSGTPKGLLHQQQPKKMSAVQIAGRPHRKCNGCAQSEH